MPDATPPAPAVDETPESAPAPTLEPTTPAPEATTTPTNTFRLGVAVVINPPDLTAKRQLRKPVARHLAVGVRLIKGENALEYDDAYFADGPIGTATCRAIKAVEDCNWGCDSPNGSLDGISAGLEAFLAGKLPALVEECCFEFESMEDPDEEMSGVVLVGSQEQFQPIFDGRVQSLAPGDVIRCFLEGTVTEPTPPVDDDDESFWTTRSAFTCQLLKVNHLQADTTWTLQGGLAPNAATNEKDDDEEEEKVAGVDD